MVNPSQPTPGFMQRVLKIQRKEIWLVITLGFLLFGNSLARQVSGIVAISGFLNSSSVNSMLFVMGIDYALILLVGGLQSLIVDRYNRIKLMAGISLAFALVFIILRVMFALGSPGWLNYTVMYLIAEQQLILFPMIFWVLANDIFNFAQTKRLFPIIASWSFVGKLAGIGIAWISPTLFARMALASEEILIFNALIYAVGFLLVVAGLRHVKVRPTVQATESVRETLTEGWDFVKGVASFRFLMMAIIALAVADTIIEFRFLVVTDTAFVGQAAYQTFYSGYRLAATLLGFGVQTFLTARLMNSLQVKNIFFIFPIVILLGAGGAIASAGLWVIVGAMLGVKLVRETVDESGRKSIQSLVPEERRGRVSTFIDNYLPASGTILACLVTGIIVQIGLWTGRDLYLVYLGVAWVCGAFALWAIFKMKKVYESSLLNWRLKRRQRVSDTMIRKITDL
jgi:AAA family ATP:ADP antiporter